jgi:5-methylcytosine-specific restriction enzyme subunit McrC
VDIPIQNIYYLLCYAWDKLAERDIVDVQPIDETTLTDLFAQVLINGTHHLVKRGFDRGYVLHHEWTGRLKGRLCFQEAVAQGLPRASRLPCEFDELSHDVLHNQILKATMTRLLRTHGLAPDLAGGLAQLCRLLSEVRDIDLTSRHFGRVQLYRNNQFYDFLLKVCELIFRHLLPTQDPGSSQFRDFLRDERQMAILFENFVRNFYRLETAYRVKREDIYWRWIAADQVALGLLPKMQTDISLTSATRKIIIDCKFTPEATKRHYEAEKLRSSHLFQIHAYLGNLPEGGLADTCEAILLYPTVDTPISASFTDRGHRISIRTINLNQAWRGIHEDLLALVA